MRPWTPSSSVPAARQGIGRALVRRFLEENPEEPSIEVLAGNKPALALYLGFRVSETRTGSMPGNEAFRVTVHILARGK